VYKMISEGLPPGLRMGNDVKEMIVECCNEFIQCVSSEANEISTKENKTTILPEHVVAALESLDFASMIETVKATMNELKEEDKEVRAEKKKKKGMQISDEEALRLQQEMFAAAKARYNSGDATVGAGQPPAAANPGSLD
tara:strand:+ start:324 stop:743 length:420 start_codon:yes stop_codon:yes gene_type:complete